MDRRAFLRFSIRGPERTLELSCERLYLRWIDAQGAAQAAAQTAAESAAEAAEGAPPAPPYAPWDGEPPLDVAVPTTRRLMAELDGRLGSADVLRVTGREWLASDDFRRQVESRIEAFRRRGGRVE